MTTCPEWVPVLTAGDMLLSAYGARGRMNVSLWHDKVFLDLGDAVLPGYWVMWDALVAAWGVGSDAVFFRAVDHGQVSRKEQARIWNKARRAIGYTEVEDGSYLD